MQKNNSRIFISYFLFAFIAIIIVFRVIYIQKSDEVMPWKDFNKNMAVSVEYDLKY